MQNIISNLGVWRECKVIHRTTQFIETALLKPLRELPLATSSLLPLWAACLISYGESARALRGRIEKIVPGRARRT